MGRKPKEAPLEDQSGQVTRETLQGLLQLMAETGSRLGEIRGELGREMKAAEKDLGVDLKILKTIRSLTNGKQPSAFFDIKRRFDSYWDLLGFSDQKDIESFLQGLPDDRTPIEKAMDGEVTTAPTTNRGDQIANKATVARFRSALHKLETEEDVLAKRDSFIADFPGSYDVAHDEAQKRLNVLRIDGGISEPAEDKKSHLRAVN